MRRFLNIVILTGSVGMLNLSAASLQQIPAFPGAEGYGQFARGGRGGEVYYVINLDDSGPGSLRYGVTNNAGSRTILFKVSGTIDLRSDLKISRPFLTIAGQTAPGDGITLKRRLTTVNQTHDVIVRYIRCRPGDIGCPDFQDDSFNMEHATNSIADHISASWSIDESLSVTWSTNITVQWCLIGESLDCACEHSGCHGYGSLLCYGDQTLSFHHNLYAHNRSRNPRPGGNVRLDFVNNVIYNWGDAAGYNDDDSADYPHGYTNRLNFLNNYYIAGPSTYNNFNSAFRAYPIATNPNPSSVQIYQSGNLMDANRNSRLDGVNTGWGMFWGSFTRQTERFRMPQINTDTTIMAYDRTVTLAGDSLVRDSVDTRIIKDVRNQAGVIINSQTQVGGWPELKSATPPTDTDGDGMPDDWEKKFGLNPNDSSDGRLDQDKDGYTNLEEYLNGTDPTQFVDYTKPENNVNVIAPH